MNELITTLTPQELKSFLASTRENAHEIIDVRQPVEYQEGHLPGARLIPLDQLETRFTEINPDKDVVVYCKKGGRSMAAAVLLEESGLPVKRILNLKGGITAWDGITLTHEPRVKHFPLGQSMAELLQTAMDMEKGAWRFYSQVSQMESPLAPALHNLADLETRHARTVYNLLIRVPGEAKHFTEFEPMFESLPGQILEGGEEVDVLLARQATFSTCLDLAEVALSIELAAYDLYKVLAGREKNDIQKVLLTLAQEEKAHIRVLAKGIKECANIV